MKRRIYRQGGKCGRHVYIGPHEEDEVLVAVGDVPTAREEARRVVEAMNAPDAMAMVVAMIVMATETFERFKPTIESAIRALRDWQANLIADGTTGVIWSELLKKIEELTEEDPEGEGK